MLVKGNPVSHFSRPLILSAIIIFVFLFATYNLTSPSSDRLPFSEDGNADFKSDEERKLRNSHFESLKRTQRANQDWYCDQIHPLPLYGDWTLAKPKYDALRINSDLATVEKMVVFKDPAEPVSSAILLNGFWERDETSRCLNQMNVARESGVRDPVFLDIGSNVGWTSLAVASAGYNVISIEPSRKHAHAFRESLCYNKKISPKITFFNVDLSASSETCWTIKSLNGGEERVTCGATSPVGAKVIRKTSIVRLEYDYYLPLNLNFYIYFLVLLFMKISGF
jgi:hypothetical protein